LVLSGKRAVGSELGEVLPDLDKALSEKTRSEEALSEETPSRKTPSGEVQVAPGKLSAEERLSAQGQVWEYHR